MKKTYAYSIVEMTKRLLAMGKEIRFYLVISALSSIIGNVSQIGLMGFGAAYILCCANLMQGNATTYLILTVISGALIAICRYLEGVFSHIGAYGILAKLRVHLFEQISRISPAFLVEREKGDLINVAIGDIETLEFFFAHTIGPMFTVILLPFITLIFAYTVHPYYACVLLPVFILISIIIPLLALKAGRGYGTKYRTALANLSSCILESVYGLKDIQIFNREQATMKQQREKNDNVNQAAHFLVLHQNIVSSLPNFFVYVARILIVFVATILASKGTHDVAGAILVSFVATASFSSTFSLTSVVSSLLQAYAAAERVFLIEDTKPQTLETTPLQNCGKIEEIHFSNVSFTYPKTTTEILHHTSFTIHTKDKIGIIGESGAGKSTLFRLLLRFYDPTSGTIYLNQTDEKNISFHELHQRIAMLEQETYLFNCSIADNIALAKPNATKQEIIEAAKKAGIHDLIETLPDQYDTQMGQMSSRLSGGEKQRIGIARIMLLNPDVIVMDEPTSALDVLHEEEFLHTLYAAYQDKIILVISHRQSTLKGCQRILKLEQGKFVEQTN